MSMISFFLSLLVLYPVNGILVAKLSSLNYGGIRPFFAEK